MMQRIIVICFLFCGFFCNPEANACSVLYYVDPQTGKIYVANNEDYWYDVEAYIQILPIKNNRLIMTNFLLADPSGGNHPCLRYRAIEKYLDGLEESDQPVDLRAVSNAVATAVQVYQLDNSKITRLDLREVFTEGKKKRINLC